MKRLLVPVALAALTVVASVSPAEQPRPRARDVGVVVGILPNGSLNAITDVAGVKVGHATLVAGEDIRTGVTVVLPHSGNVFQEKVPAAIFVGNGFGKLTGVTQVQELGTLETPIALTGTLSTWRVADALAEWVLGLPGNGEVLSVNPVVGECNDGDLSDIRKRPVGREQLLAAISAAAGGAVTEGCVGAGTGTKCLGWKGGIGTASRRLPPSLGGWTVGVLVQTNFNGVLTVAGVPVGVELGRHAFRDELAAPERGSCMVVIATDAPLDARQLSRLAARMPMGLARTGAFASNGSGDYAIAFSTHPSCRVPNGVRGVRTVTVLADNDLSPLFLSVVEATEEAVLNSLFTATTTRGFGGHVAEALPVDRVLEILRSHGALRGEPRPRP
ncbi:MAG: aminopeptidase [Acidobacteria bacterium RBG_13_68_16]|nr:MAG: aminopeptidase [Acidobacteria bacterium RBG_13_68_16]